jgi:hypothetical protein
MRHVTKFLRANFYFLFVQMKLFFLFVALAVLFVDFIDAKSRKYQSFSKDPRFLTGKVSDPFLNSRKTVTMSSNFT